MDKIYDFTIVGSSPLSALLAGLLASEHKKSVCWIGSYAHPLRPLRGLDLSVAAITRPESWQLLRDLVPETQRLLSGIGDDRLYESVDPLLVARTRPGAEMLSHMRGVAAGYGLSIERQPISEIYVDSYQFRDATRILRRSLVAALPKWLEQCGVSVHCGKSARPRVSKGTFITKVDNIQVVSNNVILADDDAIISHVAPAEVAKTFDLIPTSASLMEPGVAATPMIVLDSESGFVAHQRVDGALDCVGPFKVSVAGAFAGALIKPQRSLRLAGRATFNTLVTKDGGAIIGSLQRNGPMVLAGLGMTGAFLAPAIARVLADKASAFEKEYFAARKPGQPSARAQIAEYRPPERQQLSLQELAS